MKLQTELIVTSKQPEKNDCVKNDLNDCREKLWKTDSLVNLLPNIEKNKKEIQHK